MTRHRGGYVMAAGAAGACMLAGAAGADVFSGALWNTEGQAGCSAFPWSSGLVSGVALQSGGQGDNGCQCSPSTGAAWYESRIAVGQAGSLATPRTVHLDVQCRADNGGWLCGVTSIPNPRWTMLFQLSVPMHYTVDWDFTASATAFSSTNFWLSWRGTNYTTLRGHAEGVIMPFPFEQTQSITVNPSTLAYRMGPKGAAGFAAVQGSVTMRFSSSPLPPLCQGDFNSDGAVSSQDFFDFLAEFFVGGFSADVNHDGVVNSQDFFDFLGAFFAGC